VPRGARLPAFDRLPRWRMTHGGVEARQLVSVAGTKWTVCYKVHVIPARRTQYKASITLWPKTKKRLLSRAQPGWHADLVANNWYHACRRELRRRGYHGRWLWSPYGRFGDFWKPMKDITSLAREAHALERFRKEPSFAALGRRTSRFPA
jgi:hypothetical protein